MRGTVRIGSIAGIPIRLHWSMVILVLFAVGPGLTRSMILSETAWIVVIFACVVVHELAHCFVARLRGCVVRDVVLMPLGGVSEIIGIGNSPTDELRISLVGPLVNGVIALLLAMASLAIGVQLWPPTLFARAWLARVMWANVLLGAFNLLPAIPLDGGRALRAILGRTRHPADATAIAARTATWIALLMILFGVLVNLWFALIGIFVLIGARAEQQMALVGELLAGIKVREVMVGDPSGLDADEPVADVAPFLEAFPSRAFPVVEDERVIGIVAASDLAANRRATTLREATDTLAPFLRPDDDVYPRALDALAESGRKALVVREGERPVGVLYAADVQSRVAGRRAGWPATTDQPHARR